MNHKKQPNTLKKAFFKTSHPVRESGQFFVAIFFWGSFFLGLTPVAFAQQKLVLNDSIESYHLHNDRIQVWIDTSKQVPLEKILAQPFLPYRQENLFNLEHPHGVYWVKFSIQNDSQKKGWVLEFPDLHISHITVYQIKNNGLEKIASAGYEEPFSRDYFHKNPNVQLEQGDGVNHYLVRLESSRISSFGMLIRSHRDFTSYALHEHTYLGIYYGILLMMMISHFVLFLTVKEREYLYYVLYVMSCALYTFMEDGIGFQFLWPTSPFLNLFFNKIYLSLLLATFTLYALKLLDLKKHHALLHQLIILSFTAVIALEIGQEFYTPLHQVGSMVYVGTFILIFLAGILLYGRGISFAKYFTLGFVPVIVSTLIFQLRMNGLLPHNAFTIYAFNGGFILEAIIMSMAVGEKLRTIKKEKERAQEQMLINLSEKNRIKTVLVEELKEKERLKDKVNRELEQKVKERTAALDEKNHELIHANEQLNILSQKLEAMSSSLDKDNWELKKEVKQKALASIIGQKTSYEEFCQIFPTETSCLKYIEELKWKNGYQCRKCRNEKYNKGDTPFSRKCSKCNFRESVTAYTLYHGLRVDLPKAFYLTYVFFAGKSEHTLEELASIVQVSTNTCWSLKKKVNEKKALLTKQNIALRTWDGIIL